MFPLTEPMSHEAQAIGPLPLSPMTLSDRLITLAKDADTLGYAVTAEQLVQLALTIFDEAPRRME
jgi:hypothetical protein